MTPKAKILEAGGSVAGCVFKEDYLERARQMFLSGGSAGPDGGKKSYEWKSCADIVSRKCELHAAVSQLQIDVMPKIREYKKES